MTAKELRLSWIIYSYNHLHIVNILVDSNHRKGLTI